MIATYLQIIMGAVAFAICTRRYLQAMKMSHIARKRVSDTSFYMTLRTVKRRELLHMIKCAIIVASGLYIYSWMIEVPAVSDAANRVIIFRSLSTTILAFLIALNALWDELDRRTNSEQRILEENYRNRSSDQSFIEKRKVQ
jgi:hypothetical protein